MARQSNTPVWILVAVFVGIPALVILVCVVCCAGQWGTAFYETQMK